MTTVPLNNTRTVDPKDNTDFTISDIISTPQNLKGIPSYLFQNFFEIAKSTFKVKEKKLYCTLMCKKCVTFHKSNKKIKFYS